MVLSLLLHAEVVKGLRVILELFLFLGLLDSHVFAFSVEHDWELGIKVVVFRDHQQRNPAIFTRVNHCFIWLLFDFSLFLLVHTVYFVKYVVMIISKVEQKSNSYRI